MTYAQKYEEVFGFPPDKSMCPTTGCEKCPVIKLKPFMRLCTADETWLKKWWDSEYKEPEAKNENSI